MDVGDAADSRACGPTPLGYQRAARYVPVARFADAAEAAMAASFLAGEDVEAHVLEDARLAGMTASGATLAVDGDDVARAVMLLSHTRARRCLLVRPALPAAGGDDGPADG